MPRLTPANPEEVMVIRQVNSFVTTLSVPFARFGLIKSGGRGTLVRMQNGSVAVFSPVALTPEVKKTVESMGELKYIAALDYEHHIFIGPWSEAYPEAKVIGVEGLPEKREKQKNEKVEFSAIATKANIGTFKIDEAFDAEFEYEYVLAHPNKELVFFHKPSKTLIEADLLFNLPATEQYSKSKESPTSGIFTRLFNSLNGTSGTALAQKRLIWYALSSKDRMGYSKSVANINKWDFTTIVPCHGNVIEEDAKGVFQKVFEWHLAAIAKESKKSD